MKIGVRQFTVWLAIAVTAAAVSACGVRSSPDFPDDATYPYTYPAAIQVDTDTDENGKRVRRRDPYAGPPGSYEPPAPATQILAQ